MEQVILGKKNYFLINQNVPNLHVLRERGYNRFNKSICPEHYPEPPRCGFRTISKSGIPDTRCLSFLPPKEHKKFSEVLFRVECNKARPANIYDGISFVANEFPYIQSGEIVIGFPGLLRQNGEDSYIPLLIVSKTELAWDEDSTKNGWPDHWWLATIL